MRQPDASSPPSRFQLGSMLLLTIVGLLLVLSAIVLYFNGWTLPAGLLQSTEGRLAGLGAIGLVGWIAHLLNTLHRHRQLEVALRQTHAQLEANAQARTAQLSATNALLLAEVQRARAANLALETSETRLKMTLSATQTVLWDLNLQTGEVLRSGDLQALFGITQPALAETQDAFLERVHPDDRGTDAADHAGGDRPASPAVPGISGDLG